MEPVTIIVSDPSPQFRAQANTHLGTHPGWLETETLDEAEQAIREHDGSAIVLILGPTLGAKDAISFAERAQTVSSGVCSILVGSKLTAAVLQDAMRAGVRDVLPKSCTSKQFRETVERVETLARLACRLPEIAENSTSGRGKVITVFSAKGGCGKSVVSSNLALLLAERTGKEVALVDLDLESGDLAIMFRLAPTRTIYDVAQNIDLLDIDALKGHLTPYESRLYLLAAPVEPGLGEKISPAVIRRIIGMLRDAFAYVVLDGPSFFTEHVLAALDESDECILMASLDVPSVKNLKVSLRTLELIGFKRDRLRLVLNRADSKVGLAVEEVEKSLKTEIGMLIPSSRDVPLCVNRGVPVAKGASRSGVTAALTRLADAVSGVETPKTTRSRFALIGGKR